ncbi:MAG: hypothetical protein IJ856_03905 [Candidatus Methanomethylophilaceae archaeon]|nr:hypothetical protein [Candidatus Methanomethylophilaceae archaeon]
MQREDVRRTVRNGFDKGLVALTVIIAIAMILYCLFRMIEGYEESGLIYSIATYAVPFLCATLILLDRHHSILFAVGMYAIAIGFSRFVGFLPMTMSENTFVYMAGVVLTLMALNLMYSGYRFLSRNSRSTMFIIMSTLLFTMVIIMEVATSFLGFDSIWSLLDSDKAEVAEVAMYVSYLALAWSERVGKTMDLPTFNRVSAGSNLSHGVGLDLSVSPSDAERMSSFFDGTLETESLAGRSEGPVHSEFIFQFKDNPRTGYCTMQRWYGPDGPVYMSMSDHQGGSRIGDTFFEVNGIEATDSQVKVDCKGRLAITFRIRPPERDGSLGVHPHSREAIE